MTVTWPPGRCGACPKTYMGHRVLGADWLFGRHRLSPLTTWHNLEWSGRSAPFLYGKMEAPRFSGVAHHVKSRGRAFERKEFWNHGITNAPSIVILVDTWKWFIRDPGGYHFLRPSFRNTANMWALPQRRCQHHGGCPKSPVRLGRQEGQLGRPQIRPKDITRVIAGPVFLCRSRKMTSIRFIRPGAECWGQAISPSGRIPLPLSPEILYN